MRRNHSNITLTILSVIAIAVFAFVLAILFSSITVDVAEDSFTVKCLYHTETISYEDVAEIKLSYDYISTRIFSIGGISKALGTYKNDDYGIHYRISYEENKHNYVIVRKKDGSTTVFNLKTEPKTAELYEALQAKITLYSKN
ncbi:MAG: hypothetical protein J6Y74_00350 [Clostridia bacterium]|nr:hypothetical protein [Clostridia bacterium]